MATQTNIRIRRNPYHGYEVWLWANGELTRRSFDNGIDLAFKLAADCISERDIEAACDLLDSLEWEEPEYPLGVSYRPVAEAVCDETEWVDIGCDCEMCSSFPARDRKAAGKIRENVVFWFKGMFWIGAVVAPWFGGFHAVRWLLGGWG